MSSTPLWQPDEYLVFVYGTLKFGEPNRKNLESLTGGQMRILSKHATLVECFPMVIATRLNIPFLLDKPGVGEVSSNYIFVCIQID